MSEDNRTPMQVFKGVAGYCLAIGAVFVGAHLLEDALSPDECVQKTGDTVVVTDSFNCEP